MISQSHIIMDVVLQVYNLLAPSPEEDGVPYESLHITATGYPEGMASMCFSDGNTLVIGSKDHQVLLYTRVQNCLNRLPIDPSCWHVHK